MLSRLALRLTRSRLWRDHLAPSLPGYVAKRIGKTLLTARSPRMDAPAGQLIRSRPGTAGGLRLLLVALPFPANRRHKRLVPLGPARLAAYLSEHEPSLHVALLDAHVHNLSEPAILREINAQRWDVIGLSCWTVQRSIAARLCRALRTTQPDALLVQGGVHPTLCPGDALATADVAVMYEGEEPLLELLRARARGEPWQEIPGTAVRPPPRSLMQAGGAKINPAPEPLDLDALPLPPLDLLPMEKYSTPLHVIGGQRWPILGSLGCPYQCSYCASPQIWQRRLRFRSPANIVGEMRYIRDRCGITGFHFWDDNFTIRPSHTRALCEALVAADLGVQWVCLDRGEHVHRNADLLPLMKQAGCIGVEVGVESANPDTFAHIHKDQDLEQSRQAIDDLKRAGIAPLYTCMAYNPGESIVGYYLQKELLDEAQRGLPWHNFFHRLPFAVYIGQFATPYPCTEYAAQIGKTSLAVLDDDEDLFHHQINAIPNSLLDDVPLRTVSGPLSRDHLTILLLATEAALYREFTLEESRRERNRRLAVAGRFYRAFWQACDGARSLRDLAQALATAQALPPNRGYRYSAFAAYVLGQIGALRSATHHRDVAVTPKPIAIPLAARLDVLVPVRAAMRSTFGY
jgi:anaerobic magnesium-protoporphyrin IX monomethyl ester cyclase